MTKRDEFGWPVRLVGGVRVCARPGCRDHERRPEQMPEFRIDGYCSIYCRDMHELDADAAHAAGRLVGEEAERKRVWKIVKPFVDSGDWEHLRGLIFAAIEGKETK